MAPTADIVTLDDFEAKMPEWRPNLPNHLYALVDMGSNGIRFSISDLSPPRARLLRCIYRERAGISLFEALAPSPSDGLLRFPAEIVTLVSQTLARFKTIADNYGVPPEHISVFATEAVRKSENAASMLDAIRSASGLGVSILAPEVETLFGAMGARSGFPEVNGLFLDLGGGSVQMTYMNSAMEGYEIAAAQSGGSLPFGAARLIRILEDSEPASQMAAKSELQAGMRGLYSKLQQRFPSLKALETDSNSGGIDIYLCGGGFRGYGSMLMHNARIQPYPIQVVGAYTVPGTFFRQTEAMRKTNKDYEGKIFGMSKRRRQQFPAIATVVEGLISAVPEIRTVTFCSGGNREGALVMKLPTEVRELRPLQLLYQPGDRVSDDVIQSVVSTLTSSLPTDLDISNISSIFTLGLGPLFASKIWSRFGEPHEANAAHELHQAITRDPTMPGLTHMARAVLGLTLCARWGSNLGQNDIQQYQNLRLLASEESPETNYWSDYIGAVAAVLTTICPTKPKAPDELYRTVRFSAKIVKVVDKKKPQLQLIVHIARHARPGIEAEGLEEFFVSLGKKNKDTNITKRKVHVFVEEMIT
ncbi:Ppx/GppA phosphatase [Xylariales sp. AK1849]|nr:Ppx/GppA phosphatase [Xylariales sp. AK1849]